MTLCINPNCSRPDRPENDKNHFCPSCGTQLELQGRYRVMRPLSYKTGFGKVYETYAWTKPKILKVLKEDLNIYDKAIELFEQEAVLLEQIHHPGIPKVDGYFQFQTREGLILHCMTMEKVKGPNLEQWLQRNEHQPIPQEQALAWLKQLVEILHLVHGKQYLHRNIKPSNITIRPNGQLVLIDFGTARQLTRTYLNKLGIEHDIPPLDAFGYTAPEQLNGEARVQSDFFSLGRTFVFLLTGKHPVDMYDAQSNVLNWHSYTSGVAPLLLNLVDWLMARELGKRPLNTQDILQRLKDIKQQITAPTLASFTRERKSVFDEDTSDLDSQDTVGQPLETVIQAQEKVVEPIYNERVVEPVYQEMTVETFSQVASGRTTTLQPPPLDSLPPLEPLPEPPQPEPDNLPKLAMFALLFVLFGLMGLASIAFLRSPDAKIFPTPDATPQKTKV